jgi:hypothetical protein
MDRLRRENTYQLERFDKRGRFFAFAFSNHYIDIISEIVHSAVTAPKYHDVRLSFAIGATNVMSFLIDEEEHLDFGDPFVP